MPCPGLLPFPSGKKSLSKGVGIAVSERRVLTGCHTVFTISEIKSRLQEGVLPRNGFNCEDRSPVSVVAMVSRKFRAVFLFIVGTGGGHSWHCITYDGKALSFPGQEVMLQAVFPPLVPKKPLCWRRERALSLHSSYLWGPGVKHLITWKFDKKQILSVPTTHIQTAAMDSTDSQLS